VPSFELCDSWQTAASTAACSGACTPQPLLYPAILLPYVRAARSLCYFSSPIVPTAALILQLPCVRKRLSATDEDVVDGDVDYSKRNAVNSTVRRLTGRMEWKGNSLSLTM
jgi:hypothetical protein